MVLKANEHFFVFENEKSEAFKFLQLSAKWTTDERAGSRKAHDKSACAVTLFSFSLMSEVLSKNFDQIHIYYLSMHLKSKSCGSVIAFNSAACTNFIPDRIQASKMSWEVTTA